MAEGFEADGVRLAWAWMGQRLVPAAEFEGKGPAAAPRLGLCPVCGHEVAVRLAKRRRPHWFHVGQSACVARQGGAAWLRAGVRRRLVQQLQAAPGAPVELRPEAQAGRQLGLGFGAPQRAVRVGAWDRVDLSQRVPDRVGGEGLVADLALMQGDVVRLALFVRLVGAVPERRPAGTVPWAVLEVDSARAAGLLAWELDQALPVAGMSTAIRGEDADGG